MSKTILFISKGETASSTRYRALQYFPNFIAAGWRPIHLKISGGILAIFNVLITARKCDVVFLLRKTFPYPIFWLIRKISRKLVFDFDDAIFCNTDGSASKTRMTRFKQTAQASDLIFAGNQFLAKTAALYNPNVFIIPTSISTRKYDILGIKPSDRLDIVWIGSQSTAKYLISILPALELASTKISNLRLKIISDFSLSSDKLNIFPVTWSPDTEAQEIASSHIAIAPLWDDDWSKGKCALKVLQYMAAGVPVISSQSGMNADVVAHGVNGYFAKSEEDWSKYIETLAINPSLREQMGIACKKTAATYELENIFTQLAKHLN